METEICLQLKCSVSLPVVIDCQKDSGTTVENGTQVKPVLLTAIRFAVYIASLNSHCLSKDVISKTDFLFIVLNLMACHF